jgi:hypothetical protein
MCVLAKPLYGVAGSGAEPECFISMCAQHDIDSSRHSDGAVGCSKCDMPSHAILAAPTHWQIVDEAAYLIGHALLQDADIGGYEAVKKMLQKYGGKAFKALSANMKAAEAAAEGDRRHAITEILFFASTGDIKRMQVLCDAHGIKVGALQSPPLHNQQLQQQCMSFKFWLASRAPAALCRCRTRPAATMTSALPCASPPSSLNLRNENIHVSLHRLPMPEGVRRACHICSKFATMA